MKDFFKKYNGVRADKNGNPTLGPGWMKDATGKVVPVPPVVKTSARQYERIAIEQFEYQGNFGHPAVCDIELIALADGRTTVIATERRDNPGTSVTNAAEKLATAVCQQYHIDPVSLVWIEHYGYPDAIGSAKPKGPRPYDLVSFTTDGATLQSPQWRRMNTADWESLGLEPRGAVSDEPVSSRI